MCQNSWHTALERAVFLPSNWMNQQTSQICQTCLLMCIMENNGEIKEEFLICTSAHTLNCWGHFWHSEHFHCSTRSICPLQYTHREALATKKMLPPRSKDCFRWGGQSSQLHPEPSPANTSQGRDGQWTSPAAVTHWSAVALSQGRYWRACLSDVMRCGCFFLTQSLNSHIASVILSGWLNWVTWPIFSAT